MKKISIGAAALVLALAPVLAPAAVAAEDGKWTGEVLDLGCYERGQHGASHAQCAARCLNNGSPMGLLVDGEVVYVDADASEKKALATMKKHAGHDVTVQGSAVKADGKTTVTVKSAEAKSD